MQRRRFKFADPKVDFKDKKVKFSHLSCVCKKQNPRGCFKVLWSAPPPTKIVICTLTTCVGPNSFRLHYKVCLLTLTQLIERSKE